MTKSPCGGGCQDRHVGCHATCPKYEEWKIIHQAEIDQAREKKRELYTVTISTHNIRKGWQNKRYQNALYRKMYRKSK